MTPEQIERVADGLTKGERAQLLDERDPAPTTMQIANSLVDKGIWHRAGLTEDEGPAFHATKLGVAVASYLKERERV